MGLGGHKKQRTTQVGPTLKSIKAQTLEHEQELADRLQGKRQPASGATPEHKGDVKLHNFLLDSKETGSATLILTGQDLTKITREANGEGRKPGLIVSIAKVPRTVSQEWVLITIDDFGELVGLTLEIGVAKYL